MCGQRRTESSRRAAPRRFASKPANQEMLRSQRAICQRSQVENLAAHHLVYILARRALRAEVHKTQ